MKPSWSSLVAGTTFSSVTASAVISITWFVTATGPARFEPAVETLGLVAGLTGVLVERRTAARERRQLTIAALADELHKCVSVLNDPRFAPRSTVALRPRVYPQLPVSATEAALISGALAERRDADLLRRLHAWRDDVKGFNRRLELTELRLFTTGLHEEIAEFERALHRDDGYLNELRRQVRDLLDYLGLATGQARASRDADRLAEHPVRQVRASVPAQVRRTASRSRPAPA
jgi:hypothetical protein